jgi:hypothetical protein
VSDHTAGHRQPVALVIRFIDCINRGDVDGLGSLMASAHELRVFDEPPVVGREENIEAWRGYATAFPDYVIYPRRIAERDGIVAVLGQTTGSHLGLPDTREAKQTLIWVSVVEEGKIWAWQLVTDDRGNRKRYGLDS